MTQPALPPTPHESTTPSRRGQSFVEFALVLPMLLVLLVGIADFGRAFQAGIIVESATRSAAEAVAQEYLQAVRNGATAIDYDDLHLTASRIACQEAEKLENTTFVPDSDGGTCPAWPVVRTCIHDGLDPRCGTSISGFAPTIPGECERLDGNAVPSANVDPGWTNAKQGTGVGEDSVYVEVRACYRFTTIFNLHFSLPMNTGLNIGDVYLQDRSVFTVADY